MIEVFDTDMLAKEENHQRLNDLLADGYTVLATFQPQGNREIGGQPGRIVLHKPDVPSDADEHVVWNNIPHIGAPPVRWTMRKLEEDTPADEPDEFRYTVGGRWMSWKWEIEQRSGDEWVHYNSGWASNRWIAELLATKALALAEQGICKAPHLTRDDIRDAAQSELRELANALQDGDTHPATVARQLDNLSYALTANLDD